MTADQVLTGPGPFGFTRRQFRGLATVSLGHLTADVCQGAVPAMLPFFIAERHLGYAQAGALVLAATLASSILQPLFGILADRIPAAWLMPAGLAAAGAGLALAGLAGSYPLIWLAIALSGVGVAAFHPEGGRFAYYFSGRRRAQGMSIFSVGGAAGFAIGPILTTLSLLALGLRGAGLLLIPTLAVAAVLTASLKFLETSRPAASVTGPTIRPPADNWPLFSRISFVVLCRSVVFYGLNTFVPLYWITVLGTSKAIGNAALSLFFVAGVVGSLAGGALADRFGHRPVVMAATGLTGPAMLLMFGMHLPWLAWALLLPVGLFQYAAGGVLMVMGQAALPNRIGTATGVTMGLAFTIGGLGAPLLGRVADQHGLSAALFLLSFVPVAAALVSPTLVADLSWRSLLSWRRRPAPV